MSSEHQFTDANNYQFSGYSFQTKDSGQRIEFDSGMKRDTNTGKPRYDLIPCAPLKRLAMLYARGSEKYGDRNWELANSEAERDRFIESAFRHWEQFRNGETDEDHAIAVVWNIFAYLHISEKMEQASRMPTEAPRIVSNGSVGATGGIIPSNKTLGFWSEK